MAISPLKSETIAFEHPCFFVAPLCRRPGVACKCIDRRRDCKNRNRWFSFFAAGLALGLAACAPKPAQAPSAAPWPVIAGGWQAADPKDEDIQAAARYAAGLVPKGHGALAEVSSAQTQVVAGTNMRMVLRFADGSHWQATVWQRLDGSFALTEAQPLP